MHKRKPLTLKDFEEEARKLMQPATERERAIVTAAIDLIARKGVDGATTAEIARRAGVTEKTLFRYFPSKKDLVRRVLFPPLLNAALSREWEKLEALLTMNEPDLKRWYTIFSTQRFATIGKDPAIARTLLIELAQNDELREAVSGLWRQHIWQPMVDRLQQWQRDGVIRKEVDVEALARVIHCMNVGYFFTRYIFAPDRKWDDVDEVEKMAEILAHGASSVDRAA